MITRPAFAPANVGVRFLPQGNHVAGSLAFDDTRHVPRHSGHDPLVLIRVGMAVVVVGDEDEPAAVMDAARQPEIRPCPSLFSERYQRRSMVRAIFCLSILSRDSCVYADRLKLKVKPEG